MKHWERSLKRIAATALAVLMVTTTIDISSLIVQAAEEVQTESDGTYPIYVQGVQVTDANAADVLGEADAGATVTYDADTATLTLNGAAITAVTVDAVSSSSKYGIHASQDINLVLVGENTIYGGGGSRDYGILVKNGALCISGEGSLTAADGLYCGINTTNGTTINSGNIHLEGSYQGVYGTTVINGGTIYAEGEIGIHANGSDVVTIIGGNVTAKGMSGAILSASNVSITGGVVTAENTDDFYGSIYSMNKLVLGGDAHVKATNTSGNCAAEGDVWKLADGSLGYYRTAADGTFIFAENMGCDSSYFEFVGIDHMEVSATEATHTLTCKEGCAYSATLEENHFGGTATHIIPASCMICENPYGSTDENGHYGGTATCTEQAVCEYEDCGQPYGELLPHVTNPTTGKCIGCEMDMSTTTVTADGFMHYAGTPADLKASVEAAIATGHTDITVTLPADADAYWITPIRKGIIASDAADGSINLTLAGVTVIPSHDYRDPTTAIFGEIHVDEEGAYLDEVECVTQLGSISLPDATSIGAEAFGMCGSLHSLSAPGVQYVGKWAFCETALTSLELPEAITLELCSFAFCESLTNAKLPKATNIGQQVFEDTALNYLELLAEGDITVHEQALGYPETFSGQVDLVLNCNKKDEVTDVTWNGFTFQSVTFQHTPVYTAEGAVISVDCACGEHLGKVTISALDTTYIGEAVTATVTNTIDDTDYSSSIVYTATEGSSLTEGKPVNAGSYTASITLGEATASIAFEIEKAEVAPNMPSDTMETDVEKTVGEIELPADWVWDEADVDKTLVAGEQTIATAVYIGEDKDNYETVAVVVTIIRQGNPFVDVDENGWQYPYVKFAFDKGLMGGNGNDENGKVIFKPNDNITREQFVQILHSKEGKPDAEYTDRFSDVVEEKWYTTAIMWATENGIVAGKDGGIRFGLTEPITREEMATMLRAYATFKGWNTDVRADFEGFTDAADVSSWAIQNMQWAIAEQIMAGKGERIAPRENATRAEAATMLKALIAAYE